jgi:hypothetical protein
MGEDGAHPGSGAVAMDALGRICVEDGLGRMERGRARSVVSSAPVQTGRVGRAMEVRMPPRSLPWCCHCMHPCADMPPDLY